MRRGDRFPPAERASAGLVRPLPLPEREAACVAFRGGDQESFPEPSDGLFHVGEVRVDLLLRNAGARGDLQRGEGWSREEGEDLPADRLLPVGRGDRLFRSGHGTASFSLAAVPGGGGIVSPGFDAGSFHCIVSRDRLPGEEMAVEMFLPEDLRRYVEEHAGPVSPLLEELERETRKSTDSPGMLTGNVEGAFLKLLVRISGARRVLEIGTFTGYSALMMAEGLPADGELVTCEISEEHASLAQRYFDRSPNGRKIRLPPPPPPGPPRRYAGWNPRRERRFGVHRRRQRALSVLLRGERPGPAKRGID